MPFWYHFAAVSICRLALRVAANCPVEGGAKNELIDG